jgi:phage/plasmid-associated DNA primase
MMVNTLPPIPGSDQAIRNRLKVIPFITVWSENAPKTIEEQRRQRIYKLDKNFSEKLDDWAPAFLWLLFQYYNLYCKEGLEMSDEVKQATSDYWEETDEYLQYKKSCIEFKKKNIPDPAYEGPEIKFKEVPDEKFSIDPLAAYETFKDWSRVNNPDRKVPSRAIFQKEISAVYRLGPTTDGRWYGCRLRDNGLGLPPLKGKEKKDVDNKGKSELPKI